MARKIPKIFLRSILDGSLEILVETLKTIASLGYCKKKKCSCGVSIIPVLLTKLFKDHTNFCSQKNSVWYLCNLEIERLNETVRDK